jgi:hypothetical protein
MNIVKGNRAQAVSEDEAADLAKLDAAADAAVGKLQPDTTFPATNRRRRRFAKKYPHLVKKWEEKAARIRGK